ncbi:MAG: hypothetical protein IPN83_23750 [Holophagales bacterium]|nr:hypothetical protein [Holophagales bacterium]
MATTRPPAVSLRSLFQGQQRAMIERLEGLRKTIPHAPTKGAVTESRWLDLLRTYLPKRYQVERAFVVDSTGAMSEQLDIVIFDQQYCPFLLKQDEAIYVPAESVYAVFESKQEMTAKELKYAGQKVGSVRRLHRTSVPIPHAGGTFPPKPPGPIISGFLALDTRWVDVFGAPFKRAIGASGLDLVCVLKHGRFDAGTPAAVVGERDALLFFFLRLLARLQAGGTVVAMEFPAYEKAAGLKVARLSTATARVRRQRRPR